MEPQTCLLLALAHTMSCPRLQGFTLLIVDNAFLCTFNLATLQVTHHQVTHHQLPSSRFWSHLETASYGVRLPRLCCLVQLMTPTTAAACLFTRPSADTCLLVIYLIDICTFRLAQLVMPSTAVSMGLLLCVCHITMPLHCAAHDAEDSC